MRINEQTYDTITSIQKEVPYAKVDSLITTKMSPTNSSFHEQLIPYQPAYDSLVSAMVLYALFIVVIALTKGKDLVIDAVRSIFSTKERANFSSSRLQWIDYLLFFFTYSLITLFLFSYAIEKLPELVTLHKSYTLIGIFFLIGLLHHLIKYVSYSLFHWVFFKKESANLFFKSYNTLLFLSGLALFPLIIAAIYFHISAILMVQTVIILWVFVKLMLFYRWFSLFFRKIDGHLFLFAYFCAFELGMIIIFIHVLNKTNCLLLTYS